MNNEQIRNVFKISSLYIAATIGAGFASGKEIFLFFTIYGESSRFGIILAGILFVVVGYVLFDYIRVHNPESINDLFTRLIGEKLSFIVSIIICIFLIGVLSIMLSGMANILSEIFSISYFTSSIFVSIVCFIILIFGIKAVVLLSQIITPVLIIGIYVLAILLLTESNSYTVSTGLNLTNNWGISSVTYISYNIIVSVVVLIDARYLITSRKIALLSALTGGIGLFTTSYLINLILLQYYPLISNIELPMLTLAKNYNLLVFFIWSTILFFSMLTTAVSCAVGSLNFIIPKIKLPRIITILIFLIFTLQLTYIGFSNLILIFYPVFGYIGIALILLLVFRYVRREIF
ncbi:hypothetical protein GC105_14075 [Alkalibaculum sp. M08DMB]|uniref:Transporter n=1 Tax=Alkalibaculum sporogenes TaxID=2655001 RepID=A0A6A7KBH8_9FIRM|nr:hypothetical protein [Alkalibaculum sporogenes]MPW26909.1 hypothetical protein [Alkalibaculum sporogenes]